MVLCLISLRIIHAVAVIGWLHWGRWFHEGANHIFVSWSQLWHFSSSICDFLTFTRLDGLSQHNGLRIPSQWRWKLQVVLMLRLHIYNDYFSLLVQVSPKASPDKGSCSATTFQSGHSCIHREVIIIINFILKMRKLSGEVRINIHISVIFSLFLSTLPCCSTFFSKEAVLELDETNASEVLCRLDCHSKLKSSWY